MDLEQRVSQLEEALATANEQVFLCKQDLELFRTQHIAMKNFIQNLFESCQSMKDTELDLEDLDENLKENIRVFARDYHIRL